MCTVGCEGACTDYPADQTHKEDGDWITAEHLRGKMLTLLVEPQVEEYSFYLADSRYTRYCGVMPPIFFMLSHDVGGR